MQNSGLVSVGHLLASKRPDEYKLMFQHFGTILLCNMSDKDIHKIDGRWRFDQFFKSLKPSVESYAKFLGGILRCHETDSREFELSVERIVWDLVKFNYDGCVDGSCDRVIVFKLFAIFNRFCEFRTIPMKISGKTVPFVFHKLGISAPVNESLNFEEFLSDVIKRRDNFVVASIRSTFDEFVRDVIIEDKVLVRVESKRSSFNYGPSTLKLVTVTSRELIIQEDVESNSSQAAGDNFEPAGRVTDKISLVGITFSVGKSGFFGIGPRVQNCLTITSVYQTIELTLDIKKDSQIVYKWSQALLEAIENLKVNSDRLTKAKTVHGLKQSGKMEKPLRKKSSVATGSQTTLPIAKPIAPMRKNFSPRSSAKRSRTESILSRVQSAPDLTQEVPNTKKPVLERANKFFTESLDGAIDNDDSNEVNDSSDSEDNDDDDDDVPMHIKINFGSKKGPAKRKTGLETIQHPMMPGLVKH